MTTALLTDHYELTMLDAALRAGSAERPCVFETFARALPDGRRYGVVAGLGRLVEAIAAFEFDTESLAFLRRRGFLSGPTLEWLGGFRFGGDIDAYREGELYFPGSPILTVRGSFAECVVLETLVLSILNHDSAVASAAARMVAAAGGRALMEFGSRRTHEEAAVAAARAAYVAGFDGTSNLAAGCRYGIPTLGTSAHAFTLLHDDERQAFAAQVAAGGTATTLLVDTYDTLDGLSHAVAAAGPELGAVRIDSGDLLLEAKRARAVLDELGASATRIVASGDLDEYRLAELANAPIDAYGVGTSVVTGSGHPTAFFVYKLVARGRAAGSEPEPVAKRGGHKATAGGRKAAVRARTRGGRASAERVTPWERPRPAGRELQVPVLSAGRLVHAPGLDEIRSHHRRALAELPDGALALDDGDAAIPTIVDA